MRCHIMGRITHLPNTYLTTTVYITLNHSQVGWHIDRRANCQRCAVQPVCARPPGESPPPLCGAKCAAGAYIYNIYRYIYIHAHVPMSYLIYLPSYLSIQVHTLHIYIYIFVYFHALPSSFFCKQ